MERWIKLINESSEGVTTERYLFHITPTNNAESILKNGFRPNDAGQWGRNYESRRIYFIQTGKDAYQLAEDMLSRKSNLNGLTVIKIDTSVLENSFQKDPEWDGYFESLPAVYTEQSVPVSAIIGNTITYRREDFTHSDPVIFGDDDDYSW